MTIQEMKLLSGTMKAWDKAEYKRKNRGKRKRNMQGI